MKFWDSSALLSLMVVDAHSSRADMIIDGDEDIVAAHITAVEVSSGLWRRRHARQVSASAHMAADAIFAKLSQNWTTVLITDSVIGESVALLSRHALRASDAIQLGAALIAREEFAIDDFEFVTFDKRLALAARAEGFSVLA